MSSRRSTQENILNRTGDNASGILNVVLITEYHIILIYTQLYGEGGIWRFFRGNSFWIANTVGSMFVVNELLIYLPTLIADDRDIGRPTKDFL